MPRLLDKTEILFIAVITLCCAAIARFIFFPDPAPKILTAEQIGPHMVLSVVHDTGCSQSRKTVVYRDTKAAQVLTWPRLRLDPKTVPSTDVPAPTAVFPGTEQGLAEARMFAGEISP